MSIKNTNIIDKIGINTSTDSIALSIIDDMDWTNIDTHLKYIQEKVYRYLDYIESGEMIEDYPKFANRPIIIRIYSKFQIPEDGIKLLNNLKEYLRENSNITLLCYLFNEFGEEDWVSVL